MTEYETPYMPDDEETRRLDTLIGVALLDDEIRRRLITQRDEMLLITFGLSQDMRQWLMRIEAVSLEEFAQAILAL